MHAADELLSDTPRISEKSMFNFVIYDAQSNKARPETLSIRSAFVRIAASTNFKVQVFR